MHPLPLAAARSPLPAGRTEWALDVLMHKWAIRTLEDRDDFRPFMLQFIAATIADEAGLACEGLQLREATAGGDAVPRYVAGEKPAPGVPRVHGVGVSGDGSGDEEVPCLFDLGPIAQHAPATAAAASSGTGRVAAPGASGKVAAAPPSSTVLTPDAASAAPLPGSPADVMASPHSLLRTMAVSAAADVAAPAAVHAGAAAPAAGSAGGAVSSRGSTPSAAALPAVASPTATVRAAAAAQGVASAAAGGADMLAVSSVRTAASASTSRDASAAPASAASVAQLPPWLIAATVSSSAAGGADSASSAFSVDLRFNVDAIDVKVLDMADVDVFVDNDAATGAGVCRVTLASGCPALRAGVDSGAPVHVALPAAVCVDATTGKLQRSRGVLSIRCRAS